MGFLAAAAWAGPKDFTAQQTAALNRAVAKDIGNLVSDTVNEGENVAYVLEKGPGKIPQVRCRRKILPARDTSLLLCEVDFKVKPYQGSWEVRQCDLTYVLYHSRKFPAIARGNGPTFIRCTETLSEG